MNETKEQRARAALLRDGEARCAARAAAAKEEEQKGKPIIIPLGEDGACNVYWSRPHRCLYRLKMNEHTGAHLRRMAKLADYARWLAPGLPPDAVEEAERKIMKQAKDWMLDETDGRKFDPACVRARGVWRDDETGGVLYNAGNACYLVRPDGSMEEVDGVRGRYVYDAGATLPAPAADALTDAEGQTLIDFLTARPWVMPVYGELLAGWIACAVLAGVIPFRPQVWINAPALTGKTFLRNDMMHAVRGLAVEFESASTTAAAVRQKLNGAALPAVFDEAESNGAGKNTGNLSALLDMARTAATGDNARITKGGADGVQKEYLIRCCFLLLSIANNLDREADTSRFMVMRLAPLRDDAARAAMWKRQEAGRAMVQATSFTPRLLRRLMAAVPALLGNVQAVKDTLMQAGQNARRAELIAHLLAGAYALTHTGSMTAAALQHAAEVAAAVEESEERTSDTERCLAVLLGYALPWNGGRISVRGLCRIVADGVDVDFRDKAQTTLDALGLRWKQDKGLQVNPAAPAMREIYKGTDWSNGKIVAVLTAGEYGIKKSSARLQAGCSPRSVLIIPAALVLDDEA